MYLIKHSRIITVASMVISILCGYVQAHADAAETSQLFIYEKTKGVLPQQTIDLVDEVNAQFKVAVERKNESTAAWDDTYDFNTKTSKEFEVLSNELLEQAKTLPANKQNRQRLIASAEATSKTCKQHAGKALLHYLTASRHMLDTHGRLRATLCKESCDETFDANMAAMEAAYRSAKTKLENHTITSSNLSAVCSELSKRLDPLCDSLSAHANALPDTEQRAEATESVDTIMVLCKSYMERLGQYNFQEPGCPNAINAHIQSLAAWKKQNNPGLWAKMKALVFGQ